MAEETKIAQPKERLKFIDIARSIAILLMLEGHFVDDSLGIIYRDLNNPTFATWLYIRGFTAAIFLTVTGLIFVYLLLKNREVRYFENIRIRKGFKRVIELIFWGFAVQYYAFHVLECISMGILAVLLLFGLYKLVRIIPLWVYYFAAGFTTFGLYLFLRELPHGELWPKHAWPFVQFAFHGPGKNTIFPIIPWMGFTMFGAMIGALLHDFHSHVKKWYFPTIFFLIGAAIFFIPKVILGGLDSVINMITGSQEHHFVYLDWLYIKLGMVFMVLSILIVIDLLFGKKIRDDALFIKVGQNTLTIYVLHMVLLYGSITGIGLNDYFHKKLGPWEVVIGAVLFITFFVVLVKYIDKIRFKLGFLLVPIRKFFNKIFFIN